MRKLDALRKEYQPRIESFLMGLLEEERAQGASTCSAMVAYHLKTGGKRLRALIPLYVFEAHGLDPARVIPLGAAVEMIHNATLVHDDLQDGDEVRRGIETVWKKYGSAQAINCGDAMFQLAYRLLARMDLEPARLVLLLDRTAQATLQVIEGQAQEFVMKEERFPGVDRYLEVIRGKTSGLFALPIVGALEAMGTDRETCVVVERASMDLGMLFQIQDDLLDIYGNKGRETRATDIAEGKISMLVAHVNERGSPGQREELSRILRKPRAETSDRDIERAIAIFEETGAKARAVAFIRGIQNQQAKDQELGKTPVLRELLAQLAEVFLEPLDGII